MILLLVRHGMCDPVGRIIAGRAPGVSLNDAGREQALALGRALAPLPLGAIYSSPLDRARETAELVAQRSGGSVTVCAGLVELDYGAWTGRSLDSLAGDPDWRAYNERRGETRIPGGETMGEVVDRAGRALDQISAAHPTGMVAAVTHGDVIRALLANWSGMSLDRMLQLEIAPGSVSAVHFAAVPRLLTVNWVPTLRDLL